MFSMIYSGAPKHPKTTHNIRNLFAPMQHGLHSGKNTQKRRLSFAPGQHGLHSGKNTQKERLSFAPGQHGIHFSKNAKKAASLLRPPSLFPYRIVLINYSSSYLQYAPSEICEINLICPRLKLLFAHSGI